MAAKEKQNKAESEESLTPEGETADIDNEKVNKTVKGAANLVAMGLQYGAENVQTIVKRALQAREHVLMVRVNDETLARISDLKDAGLFRSRSEAAAYLIAEGIASKQDLYERIQAKIKKIQQIKEELRALADDEGTLPVPDDADGDKGS